MPISKHSCVSLHRFKTLWYACVRECKTKSAKSSKKGKQKTSSVTDDSILPKAAVKVWNKENTIAFGRRIRKSAKIIWKEEETQIYDVPPEMTMVEKLFWTEKPCEYKDVDEFYKSLHIPFEYSVAYYTEQVLSHEEAVTKDLEKEQNAYDSTRNAPVRQPVSKGGQTNDNTSSKKHTQEDVDMRTILTCPLFESNCEQMTESENHQRCYSKSNSLENLKAILSGYKSPSVSKVLNETMSPENRFFLKRWEEKMIAELGYSGFMKYKRG